MDQDWDVPDHTPHSARAADDPFDELPREQFVFFVRHAMSRWNRAQADYAPVGMLWENDHGLAEDGRKQAEDLRDAVKEALQRREAEKLDEFWLSKFLQPDIVYSSPFTRTIETACIGLQDIFPNKTLVVMREAREQKNFGGADSTGVATGSHIPIRVEDDLRDVYEAAEQPHANVEDVIANLKAVKLDVSQVQDEWWGPFLGDYEEDLTGRIEEFVQRLRRLRSDRSGSGGGVSIVVGHSLFFRTVFQTYLSDPPSGGFEALDAASLRQYVMPYCGVVGARFEWDDRGMPHIAQAVPILSTMLQHVDPKAPNPAAKSVIGGCVCGRRDAAPVPCVIA